MSLKESLNSAGLCLLEEFRDQDGLIPPIVTGQAPSCPVEDRQGEFTAGFADPQMPASANTGWYRLSIEAGLFSETDREFLLSHSLTDEGPSRWIRVKLRAQWDIVGEGAAGLLGSAWCRPEFRMLSLDGSVLVCGTTGESMIDIFALKDPNRSPNFRVFAQGMTDYFHPMDAAAVRRWLSKS